MTQSFDSFDELLSAVRKAENPSDADRRAVRQGLAALFATTVAASSAAASTVAKASFLSTLAWPFITGAVLGTAVIGTVGVASRPDVFGRAASTASVARPVESPRVDPAEPKTSPTNETPTTNAPLPPSEDRSLSERRPIAPADARTLDAPVEAQSRGSLEAESRALAEAQRALRDGDAERALRLLGEQDKAFAGGVLAEERAAARVLAMCAAGRYDEGRRAAERFQTQHPRSLLNERVREACKR
jgi:hypothetical protein